MSFWDRQRKGTESENFMDLVLKKAVGRNNYFRAFSLFVLTCMLAFVFMGSDMGLAIIALLAILALYSLLRGLFRDWNSKRCYSQSPMADELRAVSRKSEWASKRLELNVFPALLSERDPSHQIACLPVGCDDPRQAMVEMHALFEKKALADFGSRTRCFRIQRHDVNYPGGTQLCPLPTHGPVDFGNSYLSLCFCQRRQDTFIPYLVLSYLHIYTDDGRRVKSAVHSHGFSFSTWMAADDERIAVSKTALPNEVLQTWTEAIHEYLAVGPGRGYQQTRGRTESSGREER